MKDLGTYHVRVILADGTGFIEKWETGARYTNGSGNSSPLTADRIPPIYNDEKEVLDNISYMFLEGNYSCDCNLRLFLASATQYPEPKHNPCGNTLIIKELTVIRPDGSEIKLDVAEKP